MPAVLAAMIFVSQPFGGRVGGRSAAKAKEDQREEGLLVNLLPLRKPYENRWKAWRCVTDCGQHDKKKEDDSLLCTLGPDGKKAARPNYPRLVLAGGGISKHTHLAHVGTALQIRRPDGGSAWAWPKCSNHPGSLSYK